MKQYAIIINVSIVILIAVALFATMNPLALLGLFFLQQIQFSEPEDGPSPEELQQQFQQQLEDAIGDDPEYNEHSAGFNAKV